MPVYATCKDIDEADNLWEASNLKINKSDENTMTALLNKCKNLISAGNISWCNTHSFYGQYYGSSPLTNAASRGYSEICKMLIEAGANVNHEENFNPCSTPLIAAAESGHTEICEMLISAGAKTEHNNKDLPRNTALAKAMQNHHIETCRFLISAGSPIPYYDKTDGYTTALMYAAVNNMTEICDLLITSMGADIGEKNKVRETALMQAAQCYKAEACRFLISKGANIENEDSRGYTALMQPAWNAVYLYDVNVSELVNIYKELISGGANVDKQDRSGLTVLMKTPYPEICQLFISAGANINLQDRSGQTALMNTMVWRGTRCAGITEKPEICQLLISAGADIDLQDSNGETALMIGAKDGLVNTCKILIAAGADVTMETSGESELRGYTALHLAVLHAQQAGFNGNPDNNYKEIVKMLISAGANIDQETEEGWTPLMLFLKKDYCNAWKMCRELILGGADINKKSKDGWTPLMIAMEGVNYGDKQRVCSMLIKLGADITTETMPNGRTMLSCAINTISDICETLIQRGADVNKEDENGWTPLMSAAWENEQPVCTLFIAAGANVDKEYLRDNKKLVTALMLAAERGYQCICDILVSAGANILSTIHYSG